VVFTTSSVSAKTIASMDLSPTFPKTHQNVKHHISMYIQEKNITEDLAAWARPLASIHMEFYKKKKKTEIFGGVHGVSTTVFLYTPKLRLM
jgi:hypothetical protein